MRSLTWPLAMLMVVTMAGVPAGPATKDSGRGPEPVEVPGVAVGEVRAAAPVSWTAGSRVLSAPPAVSWPEPGVTTVELGRPRERQAGGPIQVLAADERAAGTVALLRVHQPGTTRAAGIDGPLFSLSRLGGSPDPVRVTVRVGYGGFARGYGGDWATRLHLVRLPGCAVTTPDSPRCQAITQLRTGNDPGTSTLTADAELPAGFQPAVFAIQAGPAGDNGDYAATPLTQASTWNVGLQSGDFSWSYPLRMPPAPGGPVPALALGYSSGSLDGRTGTSNNQGGWIGDGFDAWSGFIERKYAPCADDNPARKTGDQCWFSDNATLSMSGRAGELVETATSGVWRLRTDDGTRIERLTDPARGNGDDDGEYWKVTATDGMQYFFGYHRLPDWQAGRPVTDSVWTVPVYGNNSGEPCHDATFADAWCQQAWRWNLDYVLDPHGNSLAYFYQRETGWYGRNLTPSARTDYTRGGWLDRIEYGMRQGSEYSHPAPIRVTFGTAERCLAGCWQGAAWSSDPVTAAWPDTPWDQHCAAAPCTGKLSPTFWSARRLTTVTTQVRSRPTGYRAVESWTLRHEFLDAGDNEGTPLWLRGITRTGHVITAGGAPVSDPEVVFDPGANPLPNRVDGPSDGRSSLTRFRVRTITLESGGQINVGYSGPDCTRGSLPTPHTNTKRCTPAYYSPAGEPTLDWFHKYVVTRLDLHDPIADGTAAPANPDQSTFYDYLDPPAWHYTDDELTKPGYRTWAGWRGYGRVRVRTGADSGPQTAIEHRFLRGMHGDKLPTGTRSVEVADSWGGTIQDHDAYAGFQLQQITFDGPGGAEVGSTVTTPVRLGPTGSRTRGGTTVQAWIVRPGTERNRTALEAGGFRTTRTVTGYTTEGLPADVRVEGDESVTGDETCQRTTYARNPASWMIDRVSQVETLAGPCPGTGAVLSRTRSFYDSYDGEGSFGRPPTEGNLVRTEELESWDGSTPVYTRTASRSYDERGRVTSETDPRGHATTTAYTTVEGGLVTQVAVTNPLGHTVTTSKEPAWGQPTRAVDPNGVVTELTYDGLGRLTAVWLPGRLRSQLPSLRYSYLVRSDGGPTAVTRETLLHTGVGYRRSVSLLDGFLRQRQVQEPAPGGGRTILDTLYDAMGNVSWATAPYYDSTDGAVGTQLVATADKIPAAARHVYDRAGRRTAEILVTGEVERWRTTTAYGGDRVHVTPPAGGTATTTITDGLGQVTALRQYRSPTQVASTDPATFIQTSYTYTRLGQQASVTDQPGNAWSYQYDLRGRVKRAVHPDRGTTTYTYDAAGNLQTLTAPHGTTTATLAFTYDQLNRRTTVRDDTATGAKRAEWRYDQTPMVPDGTRLGKGLLTSATRFVGFAGYTSRVDAYDQFGRPTATSMVLPASESALCAAAAPTPCVFPTAVTYRPNGVNNTMTMPAVANLAAERLSFGYSPLGAPGSLHTPGQTYVGEVSYDQLGQLTSRQLGNEGGRVAVTSEYDEATRRLIGRVVVPEQGAEAARIRYAYDDAGNLTGISDTPQGEPADHQCFGYDHLRRLTEAWTPNTSDCASAPSRARLGGPAPYWQEWGIDDIGNRQQAISYAATGDTTYHYSYPASGPGAVRPHAVTDVTASGAASWSRNYTYDAAGNIWTRPSATGALQTLSYDREGHLDNLVQGGGTTRYLYDVDGNRLIRTDADGSKTLYLGDTEVRASANGATTATRYYGHAGTTVAARTPAGLHWIVGDHHGTAELAINAADLSVARGRNLPYGQPRGTTSGTWPVGMERGFVGGAEDPTGLSHLGAREYDPFTGRFTSPDPIVDHENPQQLHGYAYGNNSPTTFSDPNGLYPTCDGEGNRECRPAPAPSKETDPDRTVRVTRSPGGTVVMRMPDGSVIINGYRIHGITNLDELVSRLDQRLDYNRIDSNQHLLAATIGSIKESCMHPPATEICTLDAWEQADRDHMKILHAPENGSAGLCVGLGGGAAFVGAGGAACLVYDRQDGLSLVLTGSVSAVVDKPSLIGKADLGGFGGVGFMFSNGSAQQLRGPGGHFGGSVGDGAGIAYNHSFDVGHQVTADTVMFGGAIGYTVNWGPTFTCVIGISKPSFGC